MVNKNKKKKRKERKAQGFPTGKKGMRCPVNGPHSNNHESFAEEKNHILLNIVCTLTFISEFHRPALAYSVIWTGFSRPD